MTLLPPGVKVHLTFGYTEMRVLSAFWRKLELIRYAAQLRKRTGFSSFASGGCDEARAQAGRFATGPQVSELVLAQRVRSQLIRSIHFSGHGHAD
jgi:hypothetical protein